MRLLQSAVPSTRIDFGRCINKRLTYIHNIAPLTCDKTTSGALDCLRLWQNVREFVPPNDLTGKHIYA